MLSKNYFAFSIDFIIHVMICVRFTKTTWWKLVNLCLLQIVLTKNKIHSMLPFPFSMYKGLDSLDKKKKIVMNVKEPRFWFHFTHVPLMYWIICVRSTKISFYKLSDVFHFKLSVMKQVNIFNCSKLIERNLMYNMP